MGLGAAVAVVALIAAGGARIGLLGVQAGLLDWGRSDRPALEVNIPWLPFENETRCYDELGCLNVTRDWYHLIYRPFNVFPLPRAVIDTKFILYTRQNPNEGQLLRVQNEKTILKSNFDPKKETKIIIHGFIDTPLSSWVKEMRRELLKNSDWNVVVVDWAGGSLPLYTQATANTRLVGLEVAYFVNHLQEHMGLDPGKVHMIGHSLGAHTAGYAGQRIAGLGRITGLDPAEPYFQGMPTSVRLDTTDARFVDVIHTDGTSIFLLGYGMSQPCGHVDFYPNNGKEQPGCSGTDAPLPLTLIREGLEEASRVLVACSHVRAIKLFTDSINTPCPYIAHKCDSYEHFLEGKCFNCVGNSSNCALMGMHATETPVGPPGSKYYVATGKDSPFCRRHYRITVHLARPPRAESWVQGFMKATIHSENGVARNLDLTPSGYVRLEHGEARSFVVTHPMDMGPVRRAELYWEYDMDVLQPRSLCFFWCNDHLYVSHVQVQRLDMELAGAGPGAAAGAGTATSPAKGAVARSGRAGAAEEDSARGKRNAEPAPQLCTVGSREYADIASRSSATFYDNCGTTKGNRHYTETNEDT